MTTDRPTLHFVLLALLTLRAQSGFDLSRTFTEVASHYWSARHSQIYPALARLEADGLVEHRREPSERGPERKVFSLTSGGRDALLGWAAEPADEAPLRDEQTVKALCYGLLPTEVALSQLREVRERHARRLEEYSTLEGQIASASSAAPPLPDPARLGILLTLRRGITFESGYVEWCDAATELLTTSDVAASRPRKATPGA